MGEDSHKINHFSPGLGVLLSGANQKGKSPQRSHLISCRDDIGQQSVERTLEHIFDLPHKSIHCSSNLIDASFIRSIIRTQLPRFHVDSVSDNRFREGVSTTDLGSTANTVVIDNSSVCGEFKVVREPLLVESLAVFSSARINVCVWKGKWMYEVTLETCGVQQLGWATISCPFTDRKGAGDAEDSYAFDGKRVSKWNKEAKPYGQPWVVGDVIGCCIDLESNTISFYRNGISLGVAFDGIRKMGPGLGYYPAISLSEGERCDLNFGSRPFKYPINGFLPMQAPPREIDFVAYLLQCLSRLLEVQRLNRYDTLYLDRLRGLKRFSPLKELFCPISNGICEEFFCVMKTNSTTEYVAWGMLVSFFLEVFGAQAPHDSAKLEQVINMLFEYAGSILLFQHLILALSSSCKTAPLVLTECPYSGSYPYLALACHMLKHEQMMVVWWKSLDFEFSLEGFLSRKIPNKQDLQCMIPSVWWPGSSEDAGSESSMSLTTKALSGALNKIEEMHREICRLVIHFIPPSSHPQLPGSVFRTFLQNFISRVKGADHKLSASGASSNPSLVSLYTVILHFLSEGFSMDICGLKGSKNDAGTDDGFLHKSGKRSFPLGLFTNANHHRTGIPRLGGSVSHLMKSHPVTYEETEEIRWDEGYMDDEEARITHSGRQKPCCCSTSDVNITVTLKDNIRQTARSSRGLCKSIPERQSHVAAECNSESLSDEIVNKPSSSDQSEAEYGYRSLQPMGGEQMASQLSLDILREQELLDVMLLLYHMGVAPNFRQAFYYISHQSQSISLLDDTDKQIREQSCIEQIKRLKEARIVYREELVDSVRQCAWFRVLLFSRWKQRGMYSTCMWVVQLLLVLSDTDSIFLYIPEFYLESLVDCFHALRRSDPPFVSSSVFLKQGLASFVTFVVKHFNDTRILSADIRDLLLQSISVLLQYKDYLVAFESNKEAIERLPRALLLAFDNRSWISVANIFLRLCKGSGFGSKHSEPSSSVLFQVLLRNVCIHDEELFSSFLNRLFNTLSWTMTEFSVSIREMQDNYQIGDLHQRKCSVIFDLLCNLARVLEFWTREIPQAFLSGPDMNLRRLIELVIFTLNHLILITDAENFDTSFRRPGQYQEKTNQTMFVAPLVGIILNIMDATSDPGLVDLSDVIDVFASMDCPATVHCGFQYLLGYNWGNILKGDVSLAKLAQLQEFSSYLRSRIEGVEGEGEVGDRAEDEEVESYCCICYSCDSDAMFKPCHHKSCHGCITRHLLNSQRCFFCNAIVTKVLRIGHKEQGSDEQS